LRGTVDGNMASSDEGGVRSHSLTLQPSAHASQLFLQPRLDAARLSPVDAVIPLRVIEAREAWLSIETPDERRG